MMTEMWQLCPKCKGTGTGYNPYFMNTSCICDVCNGAKIINSLTGMPPKEHQLKAVTQTSTTIGDMR